MWASFGVQHDLPPTPFANADPEHAEDDLRNAQELKVARPWTKLNCGFLRRLYSTDSAFGYSGNEKRQNAMGEARLVTSNPWKRLRGATAPHRAGPRARRQPHPVAPDAPGVLEPRNGGRDTDAPRRPRRHAPSPSAALRLVRGGVRREKKE